jgi:hypothetical protein
MPPEDDQVLLEIYKDLYFLINWIKRVSRWFQHIEIIDLSTPKLNYWVTYVTLEQNEVWSGSCCVRVWRKWKNLANFMFSWPCIWILFVIKTKQMHCLSSIYFVNQPLHVSGTFTAHHQEVLTVYIQQLVLYILVDWLLVGSAASQLERIIRTNCCTYTVNTSWRWPVNMSKTCRGWLTKKFI